MKSTLFSTTCRASLLSWSLSGVGVTLPITMVTTAPLSWPTTASTASAVSRNMSRPFTDTMRSSSQSPALSTDELGRTTLTHTGALPWKRSPRSPVCGTDRLIVLGEMQRKICKLCRSQFITLIPQGTWLDSRPATLRLFVASIALPACTALEHNEACCYDV